MSINATVLNWQKDLDTIFDIDCVKAEVDGSVNRNPGCLGVTGIYDPYRQKYTAYKYKGQRLTNQLIEMIAIYDGLQYCYEMSNSFKFSDNAFMVVSDSLTTINMLSGLSNVRNPRLSYVKQLIDNEFDGKDVYLVYRKGHTGVDLVGNYITGIVRTYNKTKIEPKLPDGLLQQIINKFGW